MSKIVQSKQSKNALTNSKPHVANTKKVFYKKFKPFIPLIASVIIISFILIAPHIHFYAKQIEIRKPSINTITIV